MDYISTIEAGEKWKLSHRRVAILCSEGRIGGVKKVLSGKLNDASSVRLFCVDIASQMETPAL